MTSLVSEDEQGSYLAGAAAALTSRSGTIGFVGGVKGEVIGRFQAGYVAGARAVDPGIDVLVDYLSVPPDLDGFVDQPAGQRAATAMYRAGADVVFAAAGQSGLGVFEAAAALSGGRRGQLWAIGVDSDQYDTVRVAPRGRGPGALAAAHPDLGDEVLRRQHLRRPRGPRRRHVGAGCPRGRAVHRGRRHQLEPVAISPAYAVRSRGCVSGSSPGSSSCRTCRSHRRPRDRHDRRP